MVKKISNISIIVLLIVLIGLTIYKLNKRHEDKLYNVLYSEIKYQSKLCYLKGECESTMTLKELYTKKYLETQYDPITKEELNKDTKIIIKKDNIEIK